MNIRFALGLYWGAWTLACAAVVFGLVQAGSSIWAAAITAYLVFIFANGTLAYRQYARQRELQGQPPPRYLSYVFFGSKGSRAIAVAHPIRLLLAFVIAAGGVLFVAMALLLASRAVSSPEVTAVGVIALLVSLGAAFIYVAVRLAVVKDDEPLFKRIKLRGKQGNDA